MNVIKWIGRKLFYNESLKDRQERKLGKIDIDIAKIHNNDELPILNRPATEHDTLIVVGKSCIPKRQNNKKKRKKKSCIK